MSEIQLGSRTFGVQANGDEHVVEDVEGWFDDPDVRHEVIDPVDDQGVHVTDDSYGGRPLLISGKSFPGPGRTGFQAQKFISALGDIIGQSPLLIVPEPTSVGGPKQARVRKQGKVRKRVRMSHVEWQIPLIAPDPRKYSTVLHDAYLEIDGGFSDKSDAVTFTNAGDARAYADEIRITGAGGNPITIQKLSTDGLNTVLGQIVLTANLANGNRFVLEPKDRVVRYGDGADPLPYRYDLYDPASDWFQFNSDGAPTKIKIIRPAATANTLRAHFYWRDAWWS